MRKEGRRENFRHREIAALIGKREGGGVVVVVGTEDERCLTDSLPSFRFFVWPQKKRRRK